MSWTLPRIVGAAAELQGAMGRTADHQNAVQSFLRREMPTFEGR
jgi:hypothetical protein